LLGGNRPKPAAGTFLAQWPVHFVSGQSQISSRNAVPDASGRCRITGGFGELQPNGRTSSRRRFAIDPYADIETMRSFDVKGARALEE